VTGFTNIVLRRLVYGVRGEWTFTPDGSGTVIGWTYEFKPLRRRYWLVRHMLAPLWRPICRLVLKQPRAWPRTMNLDSLPLKDENDKMGDSGWRTLRSLVKEPVY
jgi:hypothetical protein